MPWWESGWMCIIYALFCAAVCIGPWIWLMYESSKGQ